MIHGDKIFKSTKNPSQWAKAGICHWMIGKQTWNKRPTVSSKRRGIFNQTALNSIFPNCVTPSAQLLCGEGYMLQQNKDPNLKALHLLLEDQRGGLTSMIVTFWQSPDLNCTSMAALEKVEKAKYSWHHKELFGTLSNHAEITWLIMWSLRQHCQDCRSIPPVEFHWLMGSVPRHTEAALVTHVDPTPR